MPQTGYNYASSQEQLEAELLQMYKSLTDPETKAKNRLLAKREARRTLTKQDTGL
jgi:hypothetical protein